MTKNENWALEFETALHHQVLRLPIHEALSDGEKFLTVPTWKQSAAGWRQLGDYV